VVYFCSAAILSAGLYWLMVRTVLPGSIGQLL
jgi:hypothetical protein